MYCEKCGTKYENNSKFCPNCGNRISKEDSQLPPEPIKEVQFYSKDWRRRNVFAIASLPYYDLALDTNYLYLIKLPGYQFGSLGLIVGLILFNLLGAIIGFIIGNSSDKKRRNKYRSAWLNSEQKIISTDFKKDIFKKIPLDQVQNAILLEKKKITINYNGEKIVLSKNKEELERFNNYLNNHVL